MDIPQEKLIIYYTENPYSLYCYTKIYKPFKDIIIEVAQKTLENLLKKPLERRICKRQVNYIKDRGFKKPKK